MKLVNGIVFYNLLAYLQFIIIMQ